MENRDTNTGAMTRRPQGGLTSPASRYNPLYEMQEQMRRMDALFNRVFGFEPFPATFRNEFQHLQRVNAAEPDVDIYESDTEYIVHAALPGIEPQDITIEATEDSIVLSAQRRSPFSLEPQGGQTEASSGQQDTGQTTPGQTNGTQTGQPTAASAAGMSATGSATPWSSGQNAGAPHTQHRQSRYSGQSRFRLVYTLPTPIDPDTVRAGFRNGVLEVNLPKQRPPSSRTVPIAIETGGPRANTEIGTETAAQPHGAVPEGSGTREGAPANKMGSSYTPSAGEDHTAQAQSIGARTDHEPGRKDNPLASGKTNPMGTGTTPPQGAPAETGRS